ncbi:MAG: type II secretion system F family protein [Alphaproteobacteria bacterium]|nr:type II secretion system F family protein [Alphaproteobacteria bacterium]
MGGFIDLVTDRQFQISLLVALAAIATVYTLVEPFLVKDRLAERMKNVADYRERLRQQQRASFAKKTSLRSTPQGALKQIAENLRFFEIMDAGEARKSLMQAGFRGEKAVITFMAVRLGLPFLTATLTGIYVYVVGAMNLDSFGKLIATFFGFFAGFYLPVIYLQNIKQKRQQVIKLAWPDSLDLLLICVESGMSIELALAKVSGEVGQGCSDLAEELGLTVAELSYLQERRQAYMNLAERTGLECVKAVTTALVQSEKYGTPLGQSLRVLAEESRIERMQEAEKKAAALPPKLTVPMIGFFMPVLFSVILGPAILGVMGLE